MIQSLVFSLVATVLLAGCTGTVVHKKITYDSDGKLSGESADKYPAGVPFRLTTSRMVYWTYTTKPTKKGDTTDCKPDLRTEIRDNVPSDEKYVISYDSAPFESSKMQVVLNDNGTLRSVNVDSTPLSPQDVLKTAASVTGVGGAKAVQDQNGRSLCTEGKTIIGRCPKEEPCPDKMKKDFEAWKKAR